jgi:hypothetical protein
VILLALALDYLRIQVQLVEDTQSRTMAFNHRLSVPIGPIMVEGLMRGKGTSQSGMRQA